eukprot:scaffold2261_cov124-Cylindrotheca_fusiformis.AAC.16
MHLKEEGSSTVLQSPRNSTVEGKAIPFYFHDDCCTNPVEDSLVFVDRKTLQDMSNESSCSLENDEETSSTIVTSITEDLTFSEEDASPESDHTPLSSTSRYASHLNIQEEADCVEVSLDPCFVSHSSLHQCEEERSIPCSILSPAMEGRVEGCSDSVEVTAAWDCYSNLVTYVTPSLVQFEVRQRRSRKGRLLCPPSKPMVVSHYEHENWGRNRTLRVADI